MKNRITSYLILLTAFINISANAEQTNNQTPIPKLTSLEQAHYIRNLYKNLEVDYFIQIETANFEREKRSLRCLQNKYLNDFIKLVEFNKDIYDVGKVGFSEKFHIQPAREMIEKNNKKNGISCDQIFRKRNNEKLE